MLNQNEIKIKDKEFSLFDKVYVAYIFLYANVFISALLSLISVPVWKLMTLISFSLFFFFMSFNAHKKSNKLFLFIFILVVLMTSITAVFYQTIAVYRGILPFLLTLVLFSMYSEKYADIFVNISTIFVCILVAGAYIGFIYAWFGGNPLFEFPNFDNRPNYFYITTCTNARLGIFIRPSGIYDEPGALSFFICAVCLLRALCKKDDAKTLLILLAGNITFSLTHILIFLFFLLYYINKYKKKKKTIFYVVLFLSITGLLVFLFYEPLNRLLFSRLKFNSSTGTIAGDTRTEKFYDAFSVIDKKIFLFGLDSMIYFDPGAFDGKYLIGENPLMPVMQFGIFSSWPYYVFLMIISFAALIGKEHFFIYLSVCVLFFQRPYFSTIGYSFYFVIFFLYGIYEINRAFANWKLSYYFSKITAETSGNSKSPPCYPCFRGALAVISYVFYSFQRFTI